MNEPDHISFRIIFIYTLFIMTIAVMIEAAMGGYFGFVVLVAGAVFYFHSVRALYTEARRNECERRLNS